MAALVLCPTCGRSNDIHTGLEEGVSPEAADVGICWECHGIYVFDVDPMRGLFGRLPTELELAAISASQEIREVMHAMSESFTPSEAIEMVRKEE